MKNITQKSYNLSAEKYKAKFVDYQPYRKSIEKFISFLPPKCTILDLGCGPGINAQHFIAHGHQVTGIDFSAEMIKIARATSPTGTFWEEDVNQIRLDKKYAAICASFVIVHLSDQETNRLLKKLPRLLTGAAPKLYLSFMTGKKPGFETTSFSENPVFFNYYDKNAVINNLAKLGFVLLSEDKQPYKETDGSITTDIFLILEYAGK
jgi:ubiquinone/menaquinone biosynthesis C-methylase UbiE